MPQSSLHFVAVAVVTPSSSSLPPSSSSSLDVPDFAAEGASSSGGVACRAEYAFRGSSASR